MLRSGMMFVWAFEAVFVSVMAYATFRGGRQEWMVAALLAANYTGSYLALAVAAVPFLTFSWPLFLVDLATFLALQVVATRTRQNWIEWTTAMQAVTVLSHLAPLTHLIGKWTYWLFNQGWSYPQLILLAAATMRYRRAHLATAATNSSS